MLLTFGRSAFAMPPISGVVLAAGSATARAVTAATAKASKNCAGAVVTRGAPTGNALRTVVASGQGATGRAVATASRRYLAGAKGNAVGKALGAATGTMAANGGRGTAACRALGAATATRNARPAVAGPIFAQAIANAGAQNWARVTALTVIARARVWGTFHEVGGGTTGGTSAATGYAVRTRIVAGMAGTQVLVGGGGRKLASGQGASTAKVVSIAGARRKAGGIGYQDGFGDATGRAAVAAGAVSINPVLLVVAKAVAEAFAEVAYAANGAAIAQAIAEAGEANLVPTTQLGGVVIGAAVTGTAMVTCYITSAVGQCQVQAHPGGATLRAAASGGAALSIAVEAADALVVKLGAGGVVTSSSVTGEALRTAKSAGVAALAAALTDAGVQINPLSPSTYVIEVEVPDTLIEALVPETLVTVDAIDTLVEAA